MRSFIVLAIVGLLAQLVDGSLGMAYGVTSTTLLLAVGISPALASASVHLAEVGTTAASGISHWRFGNVDWSKIVWIAVPGGIGAFFGAIAVTWWRPLPRSWLRRWSPSSCSLSGCTSWPASRSGGGRSR